MTSQGKKRKRPQGKIGLALGGGAARGWAHIGVLKALAEAGIRVDCIAGTSIGAVVGAVYASGGIAELEEVVLQFDWRQIAYFLDVVWPVSGLIDGSKVSSFIRSHLKEMTLEELPIPFCAVSTDLGSGEEVVLREGDIIEAVRASISVPGVFTPVKKNGKILVDGGLVNPVPVSVVKAMGAEYVIAVDLNHGQVCRGKRKEALAPRPNAEVSKIEPKGLTEKLKRMMEDLNKKISSFDFPALHQRERQANEDPMPSIFEVLTTSINIMEAQITTTRLQADPPDLLIQPSLSGVKFLEFNRGKETIAEGYLAAKNCLARFS